LNIIFLIRNYREYDGCNIDIVKNSMVRGANGKFLRIFIFFAC